MDFSTILSKYGLAGAVIGALATVVIVLFKENRALIKQLFEVQEQRRQEGLAVSKELTTTLQGFSQSTQLLVDKIQIVQGSSKP